MKLILPIVLVLPVWAQTTVYLRSSGPASQTITGATNATPIVVSTTAAHGFAATCGSSTTCYCAVEGIATGTGVSPANGVFQCHYVDNTHLSLYDKSANTAIAGTGNYFNGQSLVSVASGAWLSQVTPYVLGSEPLGYFDGPTGNLMRRLSLGPQNGMATTGGLVVSGGSGGSCASTPCIITITTTYDPTAGLNPIAAGNSFSVNGTLTGLDTCGSGGGAQSPYTVASAGSSGWVSTGFTCSGLTTGDYTNVNNACGPAPTPNDNIGGTLSCTRVSQMAYTGSAWWTGMLHYFNYSGNLSSSPQYKTTYDGGQITPGPGNLSTYASAAILFLVNPTSSLYLGESIYALNYVQRMGGVSFSQNEAAGVFQTNNMYLTDLEGAAILYAVIAPYWAPSEKAAFLNKIFNDLDDPTVTACTKSNVDLSNPANHNWVLASGLVAAGTNDATHVTLASSDTQPSNYYVNTVIGVTTAGTESYSTDSYGLITAYNSTTKVATVAGGWSNGPPNLSGVISGTYQGGLTAIAGTTGQSCGFALPGGSNSYVYVALTGNNTIASGSPLVVVVPGSGFASAPTSATYFWEQSAQCSGTANITTALGAGYTIYDTITTSNSAANATSTVTFTKTSSLSGSINVGDAVMGYNGYSNDFTLWQNQSYVSAVESNTLTVINAGSPTASTSVPSMAWRIPQWTEGDCGANWAFKHWSMSGNGVTSAVYPPYSGAGLSDNSSYQPVVIGEGGNFGAGDIGDVMILDLATANDDPRAVRDLARAQSYLYDYEWRHYMDYSGGWVHSGSGYSIDGVTGSLDLQTWALTNSLRQTTSPSAYPNLDLTGPWTQGTATQKMYEFYPDLQGGLLWALGWGGGAGYAFSYPNGLFGQGFSFDGAIAYAPQGTTAGYFRNWMERSTRYGSAPVSLWGEFGVEADRAALGFLHNDPRTADVDYTTQPLQYAWNTSSSAACISLTGWACNEFRGDAMISRTGWSSLTDSLLSFQARTYGGDYDSPEAGMLSLYRYGYLLAPDSNPPGGLWNQDTSVVADVVQFGGQQGSFAEEFIGGLGGNRITLSNWASGNHGSWSTQYGDQNSQYAWACTNGANAYNAANLGITIHYSNSCVFDSKPTGGDHIIFRLDDSSVASPGTPIATHIHYPQTGQTLNNPSLPTGTTICVNSSAVQVACSLLNTYRTIEETESGVGDASFGLMTHVDSPNTIYMNWNCQGSGNAPQCNNGNSSTWYPGGEGWTDRVEIGGGSTAVTSVTKFTALAEHKVMQSLTDTTLNTTAYNPSANWTGAQVCGAASCAVLMAAIGGVTQSSLPSFTTTHNGTAQYLIGGLTAGPYMIKINGATVWSGTVANGDNSVEFNSTSGVVVVIGNIPASATVLGGNATVAGSVVIHE